MAKKKADEKPDCEGFGIAFDEDDEDCVACGASEACQKETDGEEEAVEEKAPAKKAPAKKTAAKKGAAKKKAAVEEDEVDTDATLEERVEALEARLDALESAPAKSRKPKSSKAEKDAAKNAITAEGPYKKADLDGMAARDVKRYASGIGVNSFAKSKDDVVKECIAAQKTAAGKKLIKEAAAAIEE